MHVDKNADGHVVDQNMDRISREIAYVPLSGRIKFKRSSCMLPRGPLKLNLDVLPRGPLKLNFGRASQRSDGLEVIIHTNVCGPFTLILHALMNAEGG